MESTRLLVTRFFLHGDDAEHLGERLAHESVFRELYNRLSKDNKRLFRIWAREQIDNPTNAIEAELGKRLTPRQVAKAMSHGEPINEQLRNSFKSRLCDIITE